VDFEYLIPLNPEKPELFLILGPGHQLHWSRSWVHFLKPNTTQPNQSYYPIDPTKYCHKPHRTAADPQN